ncbi:type IV toxin-antitoxin system AbiEi family antitoxin [Cesiribacter sp. SM1]|uniref:type IV toxin-antitoxin system AbiEi family antitoxin n=1 Tax=Cesiribacter sp. SM1 TaxID=2861196 RepID=UPI001CD43711|nr:type IV toxin-antitoxin system AbiEi family antitoxin [Cesiribacter sp. SM1]
MERDLLQTVVDTLNRGPGVKMHVLPEEKRINERQPVAKVRISRGGYVRDWHVDFKKQLTPALIPGLLDRLQDVAPRMVMAEYITPNAKHLLKDNDVAYADAAGNIYLADEQLYIFIENNKVEKKAEVSVSRAFTKAGLKLLFLLLQHPEWVNEPYRFLAEQADVGLDTISKVYQALQKEKYLLPVTDRTFKWNNREKLFTNWVEGYQQTLKPKLRKKTFRALDKHQDWKILQLPDQTYWGGANAGDLLTNYLIADHWTLYTAQESMVLMKAFKWVPDPNGTIMVIEKFWKHEHPDTCVPPLIAYADLTEGDNPRYIETARMVYEKYLKNII